MKNGAKKLLIILANFLTVLLTAVMLCILVYIPAYKESHFLDYMYFPINRDCTINQEVTIRSDDNKASRTFEKDSVFQFLMITDKGARIQDPDYVLHYYNVPLEYIKDGVFLEQELKSIAVKNDLIALVPVVVAGICYMCINLLVAIPATHLLVEKKKDKLAITINAVLAGVVLVFGAFMGQMQVLGITEHSWPTIDFILIVIGVLLVNAIALAIVRALVFVKTGISAGIAFVPFRSKKNEGRIAGSTAPVVISIVLEILIILSVFNYWVMGFGAIDGLRILFYIAMMNLYIACPIILVIRFILMAIVRYKTADRFGASKNYKIGAALLPHVFMTITALSDRYDYHTGK